MRQIATVVGMMAMLFGSSPLRAATEKPRPGTPAHARQMLEQLHSTWATPRAARSSGTTEIAPADADGTWMRLGVPDMSGHVAIFDPRRDRMLVFGGADLWSLSMTDAHPWRKLAPSGTSPDARFGSAVYDPVRDRMLVIGGVAHPGSVWTVNLTGAPQWTQLTPSGATPDVVGPSIYDPARDRLLLVNGDTDFWALTLGGAPAWTEISAPGGLPLPRGFAVAIHDPVRDRVVLWGGDDSDTPLPTDVWALTLSGTPAWAEIPATGTPPEGRFGATAVYDAPGDRMIVYGGYNYSANLRDASALSFSGPPAWTQLDPPAHVPYARSFHTAVVDSRRNRMVIFSGEGWRHGPPDRPDVWALAFAGDPVWTPVRGTTPEPRYDHAAVYDPDGDRMLIFGGHGFNARYPSGPEVWEYSLDERPTWAPLRPAGAGPDSEDPVAVHDDVHHRMIVFDGTDVWSLALRGTPRWNQLKTQGTPPPGIKSAILDSRHHRIVALADDNSAWELSLSNAPRWRVINAIATQPIPGGSVAIYDHRRDRLLIWGETSNEDVWALPLSGQPLWTRLSPTGPFPSPRTGYSLIYDEERDRLVLFNGNHFGDDYYPWALSLSGPLAWQALSPSGDFPMMEAGQSAIYDPERDRMIVFGGYYFYNELNETYALAFGDTPAVKAQNIVTAAALHPAYPNPFNPRVTIPFELKTDGAVTLAIYDVGGRRVKTLVDEWQAVGVHTVTWEGTGESGEPVSSGIYFCRLQTSGITETRKLMLLK